MGYFIKELTYEQVQKILTEDTIVVLPIGGGSKEHGNHLPMGTDYYITDWLAQKVTEKCDVITLPTLPYAYFPAFINWKGSVSIEHTNFIHYVMDILKSFMRFGVWKFLIIDGGVSTHPPLCMMSRDMNNQFGVKVAVTNIIQLGKEVSDVICEQKCGGHGDEEETSMMLAIQEELVHMDKTTEEYRIDFPGCVINGRNVIDMPDQMRTPCGTHGNSKLATKEKGEQILKAMVQEICVFVENFVSAKRG